MALAIINRVEADDAGLHIDADLGHNLWYVLAVGSGDVVRHHGVDVLAEPSYTSALVGPLAPSRRGRVTFDVPREHVLRDDRYVQLMSFRTQDRTGPAFSDVVAVPRGSWRRSGATSFCLPAVRQVPPGTPVPPSEADPAPVMPGASAPAARVATVRFNLVESASRPEYSTGMFLQALLPLLPSLIPMVAPLLGSLFGGLFGGGGGGGSGGGGGGGAAAAAPAVRPPDIGAQLAQLLQSADAQRVIASLLQQVGGPPLPAPAPAPAASAPAVPDTAPVATSLSLPSVSRAQFIDGGIITGPLLAGLVSSVLPSLLPLIQQVASPQMIGTLLNGASPQAVLGGIVDALMDPNRRQAERLWQHTPEVGPSLLGPLLAQMSVARESSSIPSFREVPSVSLVLSHAPSLLVHGTPRVCWRAGVDIHLEARVVTPKPIANARLYWEVRSADGPEVVARGSTEVGSTGGQLPAIVLPGPLLAGLATNADHVLRTALVWRSSRGTVIGARRSTMFFLVGDYVFDGFDPVEGSRPIPLDDPTVHRDFWHKVWEGAFDEDHRSIPIEMKYYYAVDDRGDVARMETLRRSGPAEMDRTLLRLKTGLLLGPEALIRLATTLGAPPIDAGTVVALRSPDFRSRQSQAALARVTLRGRAGERAAVWVYPEVVLQRVRLKRPAECAPSGEVLRLEDVTVTLPMPTHAHVVGARTQR